MKYRSKDYRRIWFVDGIGRHKEIRVLIKDFMPINKFVKLLWKMGTALGAQCKKDEIVSTIRSRNRNIGRRPPTKRFMNR